MTKRLAAVAVMIVAMLGVAGCAGSPATVADVGGQRITTGELSEATAVVERALQAEPGAVSTRAVAATLIGGQIADDVAAATNTTITPDDRAKFIATANAPILSQLAADPAARDFLDDLIDPALVQEKLGAPAYLELSQQVPLTINPAYGSWSYQTGGLDGVSTGSLSVPAPAAA